MVMADSMQRANSAEPAKYLPEVGKTQYQGVTAKITFDAKGDLASPAVSIYQDKGGNWAFIETVTAPATK
jgi:branched-chain amino acid transport system substrate-binding protein